MGRLPVIEKKWRHLGLLAMASVALFALIACGGAEEPAAAPAPAPAATTAPAAVAPAPAPAATTAPAAAAPTAMPAPAPTLVPAPAMAGAVTITMGIPEVSEQFGDFEVQTYGGSPGEINMGYFDHLLVHDGVDPLSPWVAEEWSINDAGNELTLKIRKGIKFNTPEAFAGNDFGELTAHDVAWNLNRQNAVINPSLGAAIGAQLGATFGEVNAVDDYTVLAPMITDIFWGIPISEFDINDTTVRLDSQKAYDTMGAAAVQFVPVGSGPFTIGDWKPNDRGEVLAIPEHWASTAHIGKFVVRQMPEITSRMAAMETGEIDLASIDFARACLHSGNADNESTVKKLRTHIALTRLTYLSTMFARICADDGEHKRHMRVKG